MGPHPEFRLLETIGWTPAGGFTLLPRHLEPLRVSLAAAPVDSKDVFHYHKTTRRGVYERAQASRPGADAVLLWNAGDEVTEATEANLVVEIDGRKVTPPVASGLLPGTLRAELLANGIISEERVRVSDLPGPSTLWLINSVRGWLPVVLLPETSCAACR